MEENEETVPELAWLGAEKLERGSPELEALLDKYGNMALTDEGEDEVRESLTRIFTDEVKITDAINFDEKKEYAFHQNAVSLYEAGQFGQAEGVYTMLYTLFPFKIDYPMGVASCQQMQGKYEAAVGYYNIALTIDKENALAYFYLSHCWLEIGQLNAALSCNSMAGFYAEKRLSEFGILLKPIDEDFELIAEKMNLDVEKAIHAKGDRVKDFQKFLDAMSSDTVSLEEAFEILDKQEKHYLPRKKTPKNEDKS